MASLAQPAAAAIIPFPDDADRRLRRALRALDAALEEQRAALAGFRREIAALSGAVGELGESADTLRGTLAQAAADAAAAQDAARELQATAEMMERMARR